MGNPRVEIGDPELKHRYSLKSPKQIVSVSVPISLLNISEEFLKFLLSISIIDELGDEGVWERSGAWISSIFIVVGSNVIVGNGVGFLGKCGEGGLGMYGEYQ